MFLERQTHPNRRDSGFRNFPSYRYRAIAYCGSSYQLNLGVKTKKWSGWRDSNPRPLCPERKLAHFDRNCLITTSSDSILLSPSSRLTYAFCTHATSRQVPTTFRRRVYHRVYHARCTRPTHSNFATRRFRIGYQSRRQYLLFPIRPHFDDPQHLPNLRF